MACRSNYGSLVVLLIGTLALSSSIRCQVDEPASAPFAAYEHSGTQIGPMPRPAPTASTALTSNEQTRVASKLTGTSNPLAVLRMASNHPPGDKGRLIFSTPSLRFHSARFQFLSGRSPPSGSTTQ